MSPSRSCEDCGADISAKRKDARYCDRRCKNRAAQSRRTYPPGHNRDRYQRERDRRKTYAREQYWLDPVASMEYSRKWRQENPHRRRTQHEKRVELMLSNPGFVPFGRAEWTKIKNRQRGRCFYCDTPCELTMDHVVPLSRGGRHALANIVGACHSCNASKNSSLLIEWRLRQGRR